MKKNLLLCLGFLSILLVVGCGRRAVPSTTTETITIVKDSIIVKEVPKIVEVTVPGDTVTVTEVIECDSVTNKPKAKKVKAGNGRAKVQLNIDASGNATVIGGCDSAKIAIQVLERQIEKYRNESTAKSKTVVKTVVKYRTRGIDVFCRWFTGIVLFIILLVLYQKLKPKSFIP